MVSHGSTRRYDVIAPDSVVRIVHGNRPVLAFALHAGHELRSELHRFIVLPDDDRLREEDPFTAATAPQDMGLVQVTRSRYEVDLNRPRERAVYAGPEDTWGLELYSESLPDAVRERSLAVYDEFYRNAFTLLTEAERSHGRFVVFDLHSYNHRRDGADDPPASADLNPEVNLGTGRIDRERWAPVVDAFMGTMVGIGFDCRENVKFRGGHFAQWVTDTFPETGVALAIEFKKTYMDEWTGRPDVNHITRLRHALSASATAVERALAEVSQASTVSSVQRARPASERNTQS